MNLLNQPGPILKRTQNMIFYWNQVGLRSFCYLGFIWTWNLKLKSKDGTQKSSSWRKSFWYDQWEIIDFSFFFRWSNQGMYAIRVGIVCYDCTRFGRVLWRKAQQGSRSSWYMAYPLRVSIHISEGHMSPCYLLDIIKTDRSLKVQNSVLPASERTDKLSLVVEKQKE